MSFVALGEVLWDVVGPEKHAGGAPANFIFHAQQLGQAGLILSAVGTDALGVELTENLRQSGLAVDSIIRDPRHPTGTVTVQLKNGKPHYQIHEKVAWDYLERPSAWVEAVQRAKVIYFGTLAQRQTVSRRTIRALLKQAPPQSCRVFDLNLRGHYFTPETIAWGLQHATLVKMSDEEVNVVAQGLGWKGTIPEIAQQLRSHFPIEIVVVTLGPRGCMVADKGGAKFYPAPVVSAVDTVGAGDSFLATFVVGWLQGLPVAVVAEWANRVAAFVVTQPGAMPTWPENLKRYSADAMA